MVENINKILFYLQCNFINIICIKKLKLGHFLVLFQVYLKKIISDYRDGRFAHVDVVSGPSNSDYRDGRFAHVDVVSGPSNSDYRDGRFAHVDVVSGPSNSYILLF